MTIIPSFFYKRLLIFIPLLAIFLSSCTSIENKSTTAIFIDSPKDDLLKVAFELEHALPNEANLIPLSNTIIQQDVSKDSLKVYFNTDKIYKFIGNDSGFSVFINDEEIKFNNYSEYKSWLTDNFTAFIPENNYSDRINYYKKAIEKQELYSDTTTYEGLLTLLDKTNVGNDSILLQIKRNISQVDALDIDKKLLMVECNIKLSKYDEAFSILEKLYLENPENGRVNYLLSYMSPLRLPSLTEKTPTQLRDIAYVNSYGNIRLLEQLGFIFLNDEDVKRYVYAEDIYRKLSAYDPQNPRYLTRLGLSLRMRNKVDKAREIYKRAVDLEPNNFMTLYHYGTMLYLKDPDAAKLIFEKAVEAGDSLDSYIYLGKIAFNNKDYDKALEYYRLRVKNSGKDTYFRRQALKGIRNTNKAISHRDSLLNLEETEDEPIQSKE